jgi:hypothetical protein
MSLSMNNLHTRAIALVVAFVGIILPAAMHGAQGGNRSKPPAAQASAAGLAIRRLPGPVTVDGRQWVAATPIVGRQTVSAPNGQFTLTLDEPNAEGDVVRFRPLFTEDGRAPVQLTPDVVSYALITADSRWIVLEPLDVIDVASWRRYTLARVFDIQPYVSPQAISADGRRLVVSRRDCPFDCRDRPSEYYELELPAP